MKHFGVAIDMECVWLMAISLRLHTQQPELTQQIGRDLVHAFKEVKADDSSQYSHIRAIMISKDLWKEGD